MPGEHITLLYLKNRPSARALHVGEEGLPGVRGQHAELAGLRGDKRVGQFIGSGGKVIGRPGDTLIANLRLAEVPPAPAARERIVWIVEYLHIRPIFALLAGFEGLVEDLRPGGDVVFEHDVVGIVRQGQRQARGKPGIRSKLECGKRRATRPAAGTLRSGCRIAGVIYAISIIVSAVDIHALVQWLDRFDWPVDRKSTRLNS